MNEWKLKLERLKRHPLFPFLKFSEDENQYGLAELYWDYLFRSLVQDAAWSPWHAPDQTGEGNPIFSAIHLETKRGTRVIQHPERLLNPLSSDDKYFGFQPFLSFSPAEPYDPNQMVFELCFVADISQETEAFCRTFWRSFCIELASEQQMEDQIRSYEFQVQMPDF